MKVLFMILAIVLLITGAIVISSASFRSRINKEYRQMANQVRANNQELVLLSALDSLPAPVQQWLKTTGIVGQSEIQSARISQRAKMKMKPEQTDWFDAEATQFITTENPAFLWTVRMKMMPLIHIAGRDKFIDGQGEMLIKMNALIPVVKEQGDMLNEGTLQRYLGEIVWVPSMALSKYIHWETIDAHTARATMTYKGTTGSGIFHFTEAGDFQRFEAMRFRDNKPDAERCPWIISVSSYASFQGIRIPSKMTATWELAEGDWTWLELELTDVIYNQDVGMN